MYLADESGHLVGKLYFGQDSRLPEWFSSGQVRLGARDDANAWESWYAIERRRPVVFLFDPAGNDGDVRLTREGLEVVVSQSPPSMNYVFRKPGDFWVDLPLLAGDQVVGKLSLDCVAPELSSRSSVQPAPEAKHPRDLEFLRVFCELTDVLFQALEHVVTRFRGQDASTKGDIRKAVHEALHDVKTRLVPLGFCLTDLRELQQQEKSLRLTKIGDALERTIDDFTSFYTSFLDARSMRLRGFETVDLGGLFHGLELSIVAPVEVGISRGEIEVDVDQFQFLSAIRELIENSRKHSRCAFHELRVTIEAERLERDTVFWVRIVVADNGVGIADAEKEHLFEKRIPASRRTNQWAGTRIHQEDDTVPPWHDH